MTAYVVAKVDIYKTSNTITTLSVNSEKLISWNYLDDLNIQSAVHILTLILNLVFTFLAAIYSLGNHA